MDLTSRRRGIGPIHTGHGWEPTKGPNVKKFAAFVLVIMGAVALSGVAAHAASTTPDVLDFTCTSLTFDPEPGTAIHVRLEFNATPAVPTVDGTFITGPDRRVTVPHAGAGSVGQYRAELPDIFPGVWTAWHDFDCRTPSLAVTVTCGGSSVSWVNVHDPITVAVTYPNVVDTWTTDPGTGEGTADHSHPLLYSEHVTVHASAGATTFDTALDLTSGCETPPPTVPPTTPPSQPPVVPVTTPVIATGPGTPGDLATTGAGMDREVVALILLFGVGGFLIWATRRPKAA